MSILATPPRNGRSIPLIKYKLQARAPGIHVCNRDIDRQIMQIKKCGHLINILALDTDKVSSEVGKGEGRRYKKGRKRKQMR